MVGECAPGHRTLPCLGYISYFPSGLRLESHRVVLGKESEDVPASIEDIAKPAYFPKLAKCKNEIFSATLTLIVMSWQAIQPHSEAMPIRQDGHPPQAFNAGSFLTRITLGSRLIAAFFSYHSYPFQRRCRLLTGNPSQYRQNSQSVWPEAHMDLNWLIDNLGIFCNKTRQQPLQKPPEYQIQHGNSTARRSKHCIPDIL